MVYALPEFAELKLGILEDLLYACYRVAEHLPFDHFLEKLLLGDVLEKPGDRLLHPVYLFLCDCGDVKALPLFLFEKFRRHPLTVHPFYQGLVGLPSGFTAVDDEIEITVFAGPEDAHFGAGNTPAGHKGAGPFFQVAVQIPKGMGVGKGPEHTGLSRDIHLLSLTGALAVEVSDERAYRGVGSGPLVGLRKGDP